MKLLGFKRSAALAFILAGVLLAPIPQPRHLVRIEKNEAVWTAVERLDVDIAQELRTCFVARATMDEIRALRRTGVGVVTLDWNGRGKDYFLVRDPELASLGLLRTRGLAVVLESGLILFRASDPASARALPRNLARKPLPTWSIRPYLRRPVAAPPAPGARAEADPDVERILDEISSQELRTTVQDLQDFKTRYASTTACEAAGAFLHEKLRGLGLSPEYQSFGFGESQTSRNVIAEIEGASYPDDILIIGGHYDSTCRTSPEIAAPGADDNASGTAAAIEAARILSRHPLDFTVRIAAFSAEEWGLYGSKAYARLVRERNERVFGVVNLDMISYTKPGDSRVEIIVNPTSSWLGERAARATSAYTTLVPRKTVDASFVWSDHASFWDQGYAALLEIEAADNPYYHYATDTVDTLDFGFFAQTTRAALAVLTELAQPVRAGVPATPTGFSGRVVLYYSLFNAARKADLRWNAVPGAAGYNVYRGGESHLEYEKVNGAPITATSYSDAFLKMDAFYYYVVTAIGAGGAESNFSREFEVAPAKAPGLAAGPPRFALIWNGGRP